MSPSRLLVGQVVLVLAIMVVGLCCATQWTAAALGHQSALGAPFTAVSGVPLYAPWSLFLWWYRYEAYAPAVFDTAGLIATSGSLAGLFAAVVGSLRRARHKRHVTTYGSARWASRRQIAACGLLAGRGVFLGRLGRRHLRHDGPEHVLAFAPTRSGKGVGLVIPTLLSWTGSTIVHDIKGENWLLTASWRSRFSHSILFNPTDLRSARYNPLLEIRRGQNEVRDTQNIADILVDPVVTTDRRTYHLQLTSGAAAAVALSWTYPSGALISVKGKPGTERPQAAETVRPAFDVGTLCFGYTISGDAPPWRPVRAFDDGQRTYVEFPDTIATREAPPFFITGPDQAPALVNYRMRGRFYIIDRLFDQAELRLGQKKQMIVRITWTRGDRAQVCK